MKKILIVDDMQISREMTAFMLSEKYETFCAASAKEAMEIYRRERPDMVLSDFQIPDMTGCELQNELQNEFHTKIPFIFMMTDNDRNVKTQILDNDAMDFIHKPFTPEDLLRRVANVLRIVGEIQGKTSATVTTSGSILQ